MNKAYDMVFLGNYSKDEIVAPTGRRILEGGGVNYGSRVPARMGLKVAVVTRLAREDVQAVKDLEKEGIDVFPVFSNNSSCFRLVYPTTNWDQRDLFITSFAGPILPEHIKAFSARTFVVSPSLRGEVPKETLQVLKEKQSFISLDLQGYLRIVRKNELIYGPWEEKEAIMRLVDVCKADVVEAKYLTGEEDPRVAARVIASLGPKEVLITAKEGLLVYDGVDFYENAFHSKEINGIGRSGRGDTCIGAYMASRLQSSPAKAAIWAAAATSLKMEAEGFFKREIKEVEELVQKKY